MLPVDVQWQEVNVGRDLNAANFGNGIHKFSIDVTPPFVFYPARSYMRYNVTVSGAAGANLSVPAAIVQPTVEQQIALAEGCIANCYTSGTFSAANREISAIGANFAQASAVEFRTSNSGAYNNKLGAYAQGYNGDRSSRVIAISKTLTGAAGYNALSGVNLNEGKEEIYRPTNGITPDLATLAGLTETAGITMAGGASITAADVGSTLIVAGRRYVVLGIVGGLVNVGVGFSGAIAAQAGAGGPPIVPATPAIAANTFAATADWYLVRRNTRLSSQAKNVLQVIWAPKALGIFRQPDALTPGKYTLALNPDPQYQLAAVEYPYASVTGYGPLTTASAAYSIAISDVKFYACMGKLRIPENNIQRLRLTEFEVIPRLMSASTMSTTWTVPGSTKVLYMFLQDLNAGTNPIIPPSVFRVNGISAAATPTVAPTGTGLEQNLSVMQVTYGGMRRPDERFTNMGFIAGTNMLTQIYMTSLLETGRNEREGGPESFDEFLQRGPLYCWRFDRDSGSLATEATTVVTYDPTAAGLVWTPCNLFMCAEYTTETKITSKDGLIIDVIQEKI